MKTMNRTYKLCLAAVLCAVAVVGSLFYVPIAGSKCAPVQHMVNILCAVLLGPGYGVEAAFVASLLRNLLSLGSPLAFPGSMLGALLDRVRERRPLIHCITNYVTANDCANLLLACGADGVHVGQSDMEVKNVRAVVRARMMIGATTKTVEQAVNAQRAGADYLGVGAVFSSPTKPNAIGITHQTLWEICTAVDIPVVSIGGITGENMPELSGLGMDGVVLVSAIFAARDIEARCRELKELARKIAVER